MVPIRPTPTVPMGAVTNIVGIRASLLETPGGTAMIIGGDAAVLP